VSATYPPGVEVQRWASISLCGRYRYSLARWWGPGARLAFLMCNPSTADAEQDDPTIRRCVGFARREGYDGIQVFNLYAYRATKPADLWAAWKRGVDIRGGERNDDLLAEVFRQSGHQPVVAAWGQHPKGSRIQSVLDLHPASANLLCLGTTKAGEPRHPLMVRADQPLGTWSPR
jgi:hypothetical protein